MQTSFTAAQLADPRIGEANGILRTCVHCGFCTATCPTYVLLGDELDSPRGRIYLIKNMLEKGEAATAETVKHIDRCLSCLSCMTTCPSGVHYMHLIDTARTHVEATYRRPLLDRMLREALAFIMPRPGLFRLALIAARVAKSLQVPVRAAGLRQIAALLNLIPSQMPRKSDSGHPGTYPAIGRHKGRVALLMGCVQSVLDPDINAAALRLLRRHGFEVIIAGGESCCGSLTHHMGKEHDALARARRNIDAWTQAGVEAVVITASGCGTTVKDYGFMLRFDVAYAEQAKAISAKAKDITEFLSALEPASTTASRGMRVAYHSACSMQHGQKLTRIPQQLLRAAGFEVVEVPEGHICCGSAGTYNILQPDIAERLRARKIANIEAVNPDVIATGNIGCMAQIAGGTAIPIVHTVQLLDWAHGGEAPPALSRRQPVSPGNH